MQRSRILPLLLIAFLTACAMRAEQSSLIIPLSEGAALSPTNSPGIATRLTFNDRSAWFVFDTGAGAHTLAQWYVDAADIRVDPDGAGVSARDATGNPVELRVVRNQTGMLADGGALSLPVSVVADFPPEFEQAEIGGLLNPQLLATEHEAVVMDLRVPELRMEPFDAAVRRLEASPVGEEEVSVCRSTAVTIPNLLFALLVRVNEVEGWLQLDTGADETLLTYGSRLVKGVRLEQGGETMGIAGRRQKYQKARDLELSLGKHRAVIDAHVVESPARDCGPDGLLGLDVLGRCALIMSQRTVAFTCDQ